VLGGYNLRNRIQVIEQTLRLVSMVEYQFLSKEKTKRQKIIKIKIKFKKMRKKTTI